MELLAIGVVVVAFIGYGAWRDWLFSKTLKDQELLRQKPLEKASEKMMAKDLADLKYRGEPNEVSPADPNVFDLTEDLAMHIPKEFNIEIEKPDGEISVKKVMES